MTDNRNISSFTKLGIASIAVAYTGLVVAVNAGMLALEAGLEAMFRKPKQEYIATLLERNTYAGLNTKTDFVFGKFRKADGDTVTLMDGQCVLDGKIWPNSIVPKLQVGETYKITQRDDLASKIIGAKSLN